MKTPQICFIFLLWILGVSVLQAQSFDSLWKQVKQAEGKRLPQTIIKLSDEIYKKGEKEKNFPQMLKAYMWWKYYTQIQMPDSNAIGLQKLEQWIRQTSKPVERSILNSLIADIYVQNLWPNMYRFSQGKCKPDTLSTDINKWTTEMLIENVIVQIQKSLENQSALLEASSYNYLPLINLGETSKCFNHDLFHLLVARGISILEQVSNLEKRKQKREILKQMIDDLYKDQVFIYRDKSNEEAYLLTSLDYFKRKYNIYYGAQPPKKDELDDITQNPYLAELNKLLADYKSFDACFEVFYAKAKYVLNYYNQQNMALQLCDEAIRLYPRHPRINGLKYIRENILTPSLKIHYDETAFPGKNVKVFVKYRNLSGITFRLFQTGKIVWEQNYSLSQSRDHAVLDTFFIFKAPDVGEYVMKFIPDSRENKMVESDFKVTHFKVLTCQLSKGLYKIVTLDVRTGYPIPNASVQIFGKEGNFSNVLLNLTTDSNGEARFLWDSRYQYLKVMKGADIAMPEQSLYDDSNGYNSGKRTVEEMLLLTDRSLYRPGQTVLLKGLAYKRSVDSVYVLSNKEDTIVLSGEFNNEIVKKKIIANEFGQFTTNITLPLSCPTGKLEVRTGQGKTTIHVEDYKLSAFDLSFDEQEDSFQPNQEVLVKGKVKSQNSVALQDYLVEYTVTRFTYDIRESDRSKCIARGEVILDKNGNFTLPIMLEEHYKYVDNDRVFYHYQIETSVIDKMKQKTQPFIHTIYAAKQPLSLQAYLDKNTCKDRPVNAVFNVYTPKGLPVQVNGVYNLYIVKDKTTNLSEGLPVSSGEFISNKDVQFDWKNLPSGPYILKVSVRDSQGKEITTEVNTALWSVNDKLPPTDNICWTYEENTQFDAKHPGVFYVGTSEKDVYIMMNVLCGGELLESKSLNLSEEIMRFEYPYKDRYGDVLIVNFCVVKDGLFYSYEIILNKRYEQSTAMMKQDMCNDNLWSLEKANWKLDITYPEKLVFLSNVLTPMYNASFDEIWSKIQELHSFYRCITPGFNWNINWGGTSYFNDCWDRDFFDVPEMEYDHFAIPDNTLRFIPPVIRKSSR